MKYTAKNKSRTTKFSPATKYTTKYTTTTESYDFKDNPVDIPDEKYDDKDAVDITE